MNLRLYYDGDDCVFCLYVVWINQLSYISGNYAFEASCYIIPASLISIKHIKLYFTF